MSSSSSSFGEMILTAMNRASMRIQLLTFLPQFYPLLIPNGKLEKKLQLGWIGMNEAKTETHQFLRDLSALADWPTSKKRTDSKFPGALSGRVVPTVELDHDQDEKDHEGMCCQSKTKSYKKLRDLLKRDKFQCQFLRELLAAGRTSIIANPTAAGSQVDVDVNIKIDPNSDEAVVVPSGKSVSVVKLCKLGLKSRYSSHLQKSLKERDVQSTICLLNIIANTDTVDEHDFKLKSGHDCEKNIENLVSEDVTSPHYRISELENYKLVLNRAFQFLQDKPESMASLCKIMNDFHITDNHTQTDVLKLTTLRPQSLNEFLKEVNRLRNFLEKRLRSLEIKEIQPNSNQNVEERWLISASDHEKRVTLSNKILELKKALSTTKSKWDNISTERKLEIKMLQAELLHIRDEAGDKVLETATILETENMIQAKAHKIRLEKFENAADKREERLFQAIVTLDGGYRGLRSYRKAKEAELQRAIWEYNKVLVKQRHNLNELFKEVKTNDEEIQRLDAVQLSMQDTYEEMKTTKRLRELLQNLQMAESVRENWAARRIQTAWKRYKARKLRKRKIKKPKKKKKEEKGSGGGTGGIGGVFFGLGAQPKTVAERRKLSKTPKP